MWQVQIYDSDCQTWWGWAHTDYDEADEKDARRAARIARRYGWKTRVVKVAEPQPLVMGQKPC